jgi:enolase
VLKAVEAVNEILGPAIEGLDCDRAARDRQPMIELDGTPNKSTYGANAMLGVSLAVARAAAASLGVPLYRYLGGPSGETLPVPMMNVINGGKHAEGALQIQECMIVPSARRRSPRRCATAARLPRAGQTLARQGLPNARRRRGRLRADARLARQALELLVAAIEKAGYKPGDDVAIALDPASTEFFKDGAYYPHRARSRRTRREMVALYEGLVQALSDRLDRRRPRRRRLGRLESAHERSASSCNSSATISS